MNKEIKMAIIATADAQKFGLWFLSDIVDWIDQNLDPEEVYSEDTLRNWALDNGMVEDAK